MQDFAGKVAVITGAGSGIGRALAQACAREGMIVVLADIAAEALDEVAAELSAAKAEGMAMTCDVSRAAEVEELAGVAFGRYGAVHLLCNNAGVAGTSGPSWALTEEEWRRDLEVNLSGVIHGIRAFVPRMIEQEGEAHIVNTASLMGLLPTGMAASYGVSKAGVVALSEALALELEHVGSRIGVSVLCPGPVATGIAKSLKVKGVGGEAVRAAIHDALQGGMNPAELAAQALAAVREGRFAVLPWETSGTLVQRRIDGLIAGSQPEQPQFGSG